MINGPKSKKTYEKFLVCFSFCIMSSSATTRNSEARKKTWRIWLWAGTFHTTAMRRYRNILLYMNMWTKESGLEKYINLAPELFYFPFSSIQNPLHKSKINEKVARRTLLRAHRAIIKIHDTYIYMIECQYRKFSQKIIILLEILFSISQFMTWWNWFTSKQIFF